MNVTFKAIAEPKPGAKWQAHFRRHWPGWRDWYLARGGERQPRLDEAERALRRYMPELVAPWQRLVDLAGGDETAARFLTFWRPPAYLIHCSQAVLLDHGDGPILVRNYDLDPALNEGTVLKTAWKGRPVIAMTDGIAGIADGINERGLAASLTFGGRTVVGNGFGAPLIVRYILEVCDSAADAIDVLRRVPSHMAYNVTVLDREGRHATAYLSPDRPTIVTTRLVTTNHQIEVEMANQARFSRTLEREHHLEALLAEGGLTHEGLIAAFLKEPLFATDYARGFGTVYTAAYRPAEASLELCWPGHRPWRLSCADFRESRRLVRYPAGAPARPHTAPGIRPEPGEYRYGEAAGRLPDGFVEALLQGILGREPDRWQRFAALWADAPGAEAPARHAPAPTTDHLRPTL